MYLNPFKQIKQIVKTIQALIYGSTDYPPNASNILSKFGNDSIASMQLIRAPVPSLITGTLDLLSNGKVSQLPYDKLFHLSIKFTTSKGSAFILEKNEVINLDSF